MLDFKSTQTFQSKAFPDVSYTIRKPSVGARAELHFAISAAVSKYDAKVREIGTLRVKSVDAEGNLVKDKDGNQQWEFTDTEKVAMITNEAISIDTIELIPSYVRWGLVSMDGIVVDGQVPTAQLLIDKGPESLVAEIADSVKGMLGLTGEQQKNSQSPTTSSGAAGEIPKSTTVNTASNGAYTASDLAHATPI